MTSADSWTLSCHEVMIVVLRWYNASIGSDNQLLTWFIDTSQADIPATTVDFRLWHTVDVGGFRTALMMTLLSDPDHWAGCMLSDPDHWTGCSVDDVAQLYGTVLTGLADTCTSQRGHTPAMAVRSVFQHRMSFSQATNKTTRASRHCRWTSSGQRCCCC